MTNELKRYDIDSQAPTVWSEKPTGKWVRYDDVKAYENKLRADAVRNAAKQMLRRYELEGNGDLCQVDFVLMNQYADKIEEGEL